MEVLLNPEGAKGWRHAVQMLYRNGGVRGFWKGNFLNCVRTAPFKAVNYLAFDTYNRFLQRQASGRLKGAERFVAGACAGVTATVTCFPLDVVRTRMMSPKHKHNVFATVTRMWRHEGVGAFYTGVLPAMVSMALGGAIFYGTYDLLKVRALRAQGFDPYEHESGHHRMRLSVAQTLLFGAMAGMTAEVVTYPFEVVRRKMQLASLQAAQQMSMQRAGQLAMSEVVRLGLRDRLRVAFQLAVKQHGLRGLYTGMLPNTLQVLPGSATAYFAYETMKVFLDVRE